ncbi:MAG: metalloregulator ArsR/SmtB family transcription factor [Gemmatimonadota bacterium]
MSRMTQLISLDLVQDAARVLRCIGHPLRLRIIELLDTRGELNVSAIQEALELEQAAASQHLNLMRDRGILRSRRDGVNVFYAIGDEKVIPILNCLRACDVVAPPGRTPGRRARART